MLGDTRGGRPDLRHFLASRGIDEFFLLVIFVFCMVSLFLFVCLLSDCSCLFVKVFFCNDLFVSCLIFVLGSVFLILVFYVRCLSERSFVYGINDINNDDDNCIYNNKSDDDDNDNNSNDSGITDSSALIVRKRVIKTWRTKRE